MDSKNSPLLSALGRIVTSFDFLLFSILTILTFIISTYFYNNQFPDHSYPTLLKFLSYIA
ncbi:hypothetical protein CN403_12830 [Bacillus cereus]|nr:hypothetical protein CN403_12830 [Bacillus cereus]